MRTLVEKIRQVPLRWVYVLGTSVYLFIASGFYYTLLPEAYFDDGLQFKLAKSLSGGHWLGQYNDVTLAKGIVFPAWMALLHTLDIPLWFGDALLYIFACLAFAYAIRRIILDRRILVGIYLFILFNPVVTLRSYRDTIAPALCLMIISWMIGVFLMVTRKPSERVGGKELAILLSFGILGLPMWWYLREDYFWVLPFVAGGSIVILLYLIYLLVKKRVGWRGIFTASFLITLPLVLVVVVGVVISFENLHHYKRFVVNDYTSHDFTEAYGALTRIKDDKKPIDVPVSRAMRKKAYAVSPAFRELQPCLESRVSGPCVGLESMKNGIYDYRGGWFFWALRQAVAQRGYYTNASTAEAYYTRLAKEINNACNSKKLDCPYGERASLAPPFDKKIIGLVIDKVPEAFRALVDLSHTEVTNNPTVSVFSPDREDMSRFLNTRYNPRRTNPGVRVKQKLHRMNIVLYQRINRVLTVLSLMILCFWTITLRRQKENWRLLVIAWGLLLLVTVRVVMLSYVDITSFPAIDPLYFSSTYPIMFSIEGLIIASFFQRVDMGRVRKMLKK